MIATCTSCQARYQLDDAKVPQRIIKVRCPACNGVFSLDGSLREPGPESEVMNPPKVGNAVMEAVNIPPVSEENSGFGDTAFEQNPISEVNAPSLPEQPAQPALAPEKAPTHSLDSGPQTVASAQAADELAEASVATLDEPSLGTGKSRRRRCKEEMLARALVSDILVYNRETRDAGLAEGNLLESLGGEIKKSWELYKEKVTPEVANSTTYFREALNEILADGEQVF